MKTFYSYSFGCRVNEAEKEEIDRQMMKAGFSFDSKKPDIYIINSCAITHKAEREARQLVYKIKKSLPESKIIVTGCAATYWLKNQLYKNLGVELIDNINKEFLVKLVQNKLSQHNYPNLRIEGEITNKFIGSGRVMIKIQDGCQRFCTYCIVPYLRGTPKSFLVKELVAKINSLTSQINVNEVILTAINTEAFGLDTKESLIQLLKKTIDETKVPRISLGSIHPWSVNEDFFNFYKEYLPKKRLVDFFHIPLQSGSDKILTLMKRGYTRQEFVEKLDKLAKINPLALIATDVIVGFFEETDQDFEDTYDFLKKSPITKFHVFRYSKRANTAGFYMAKRLKEPTSQQKEKRAKALIDLGQKKYKLFLKKNIGRTSQALLLEKTTGNYRVGLIDNNLPVLIDLSGRNTTSEVVNKTLAGEIFKVKIIDYKSDMLFGKIVI